VALYAADEQSRKILSDAVQNNEAVISRGSWWIVPKDQILRRWPTAGTDPDAANQEDHHG
jgi:hypothetical protein